MKGFVCLSRSVFSDQLEVLNVCAVHMTVNEELNYTVKQNSQPTRVVAFIACLSWHAIGRFFSPHKSTTTTCHNRICSGVNKSMSRHLCTQTEW